jgi:hypothetical protein
MIGNRKQKELETFFRSLNITNWVLLLQKGVFTMDEWAQANEKITKFFIQKQEEGKIKDYNELLAELQEEVNNWED